MESKKIVDLSKFYISLMTSTSDIDSGQILSPYAENRRNYLKKYWQGKFKVKKQMINLN